MFYYPSIEKPTKIRFGISLKVWALPLLFMIMYDGELLIQFLCIGVSFPTKENGGWL